MKWVVYILECSDSSLYTGMTNDLERRLEAHKSNRGAKYTKYRSPLRVRYVEYRRTKSAALTREAAIKSLARSEKLTLIAAQPPPSSTASPFVFLYGQRDAQPLLARDQSNQS